MSDTASTTANIVIAQTHKAYGLLACNTPRDVVRFLIQRTAEHVSALLTRCTEHYLGTRPRNRVGFRDCVRGWKDTQADTYTHVHAHKHARARTHTHEAGIIGFRHPRSRWVATQKTNKDILVPYINSVRSSKSMAEPSYARSRRALARLPIRGVA